MGLDFDVALHGVRVCVFAFLRACCCCCCCCCFRRLCSRYGSTQPLSVVVEPPRPPPPGALEAVTDRAYLPPPRPAKGEALLGPTGEGGGGQGGSFWSPTKQVFFSLNLFFFKGEGELHLLVLKTP